jgi:hypothetical protein
MEEVEKYTKLWDLPQGYGNNWDHPYWKEIGEFVREQMGFNGYESILDVGGGNGGMRKFFPAAGYTTLDIAPNSGADIIADISEYDLGPEDAGSYDWVVAIDMLEHLPTDRVHDALRNINNLVRCGAVFLISTRPDRGGKKIGATLHMTVREPGWWVNQLADHFTGVQCVRVVKGEYCIVVCL